MRNLKILILIVIINLITLMFTSHIMASEQDKTSDFQMNITPPDSLFDLENMKPGDWAPRTIEIENEGKIDFEYSVELQTDKETKLFNELQFEIFAGKNELYAGKLAEFQSFNPRKLTSASEEDLQMTIIFPKHLGNEYQGLSAHFTLIFTAESAEGESEEFHVDGTVDSEEDIDKSGLALPKTATNIFSYIMIGGMLILFGGLVALYTYKNNKHN